MTGEAEGAARRQLSADTRRKVGARMRAATPADSSAARKWSSMTGRHGEPGRRLRILMIAPTSFFSNYGCHVRILEEARALQCSGHTVTIATYPNGGDAPGLDIRRAAGPPGPRRAVVGSSRHKMYLDAALLVSSTLVALRARPDLIHAHLHEGALIGGVIARLLRRPLVFDYQGSLTAEMIDHGFLRPDGPLYRPTLVLEHVGNRLADRIVTSTVNASRLLRDCYGVPSRRVRPVADGVDTDRFRPGPLSANARDARRAYYGISADCRVIVYLGLLAPHQGTNLLLEAAKIVVAAEPRAFFLLGGFPGNETYRLQANDLGIGHAVSFPGAIPYALAEEFLALGDVAVGPKISQTEGNGKLYNYMAMALPTVAFDLPANREILGAKGIYARPADATDLADKLLTTLAQPERAAALGIGLRDRAVKQLSWRSRVHELEEVYRELLTDAPGRRVGRPQAASMDD